MLLMNQVALSNYHYTAYSFDYFLRSIKKYATEKIELYAASPHLSILDATNSEVATIAKKIRNMGFQVCCVTQEQCVYPINIASDTVALRQRSIRSFERCIEIADSMEAPKVLVTPGRSMLDASREEAWKRSVDALFSLCNKSEPYGIQLVLEGVTHLSTNLATSAKEVNQMIDAVNHPMLTSMIDICVLAREELDPESSIQELGNRLKHVHLADFYAGARYALGDGQLPLPKWFSLLEAVQYSGDLALEITNHVYDQNPDECTERCMQYLKQYLG